MNLLSCNRHVISRSLFTLLTLLIFTGIIRPTMNSVSLSKISWSGFEGPVRMNRATRTYKSIFHIRNDQYHRLFYSLTQALVRIDWEIEKDFY